MSTQLSNSAVLNTDIVNSLRRRNHVFLIVSVVVLHFVIDEVWFFTSKSILREAKYQKIFYSEHVATSNVSNDGR
jgi:hypothetical protein